ncbi:MAG: NfeD family protein [Kiritimatiellae bacterium]|nr:NfeD family protein [Kiritimatiellia bacterium]
MSLSAIWLITGIVLIASELVMPGFIVIFFGIGALIAALFAYCTDVTLVTQGYIFVIASLLSLILGRYCFRKTLHGKCELAQGDADDDGLVGAIGTVTHAIQPPQTGRVSVRGSEWTAIAERPIAAGTTVKVTQQQNITLTVE